MQQSLWGQRRELTLSHPHRAEGRDAIYSIESLTIHIDLIMSIEYVSQDEIEAHEAAMQRMVEDEKKKREAINDKKKRSINDADEKMKEAIKAAEEKMRKAIEAAQKEADEAIQAAKRKADEAVKAAEFVAARKLKDSEEKILAMQRDFECLPLLRQVYHEAPDDVFELIVSKCKKVEEYGWGLGGLNAFRLVNKRCKQVVESCTTILTNRQQADGPDSLPIPIIQRCRRIDEITCLSHNLRSLEGD